MSPKSIVLLDKDRESLKFQELVLSRFYAGKLLAFSREEEIDCEGLRSHSPELIILDSSFTESPIFSNLIDLQIPVVLVGTDAEQPVGITGVLPRPLTINSLTMLVKNLSGTFPITPEYLKIPLEYFAMKKQWSSDLYLKLSDKSFVKLKHKGDELTSDEISKLIEKGVKDIYLDHADMTRFLTYLEKSLSGESEFEFVLENLEAFEAIAKAMKWSPEVIIQSQRIVADAVRNLSRHKEIIKVLKERARKGSRYNEHISLLAYILASSSSTMAWLPEGAQLKLVYAALLHDAAIENEFYEAIDEWNKMSVRVAGHSLESLKYKMHPYEASKFAQSLDVISSDVEQIILQHHESPDGRGFPRGIDYARIHPLAAMFIIAEDLVSFLSSGQKLETSIVDFITWGRERYRKGQFKRIFDEMEKRLIS